MVDVKGQKWPGLSSAFANRSKFSLVLARSLRGISGDITLLPKLMARLNMKSEAIVSRAISVGKCPEDLFISFLYQSYFTVDPSELLYYALKKQQVVHGANSFRFHLAGQAGFIAAALWCQFLLRDVKRHAIATEVREICVIQTLDGWYWEVGLVGRIF